MIFLDDATSFKNRRAKTALEAFGNLDLCEEEFLGLGRPTQGWGLEMMDFFSWCLGIALIIAGYSGFYYGWNTLELGSFWIVAGIAVLFILSYGEGTMVFLWLAFNLPFWKIMVLSLFGEVATWVQLGAIGLYAGWFWAMLLLVGSYLLIGGHLHDHWYRRRIWYGLTQQQLLITYVGKVVIFPLGGLHQLELERRSQGTGIIRFQGSHQKHKLPKHSYWLRSNTAILYGIPEAEKVFQLMQSAIKEAQEASELENS